ncbi:MAG: hypothetical protein IT372_07940 [Polyangiaceae bacterium]|nr:hypothetical protein [Polyangiaceae bacterium]
MATAAPRELSPMPLFRCVFEPANDVGDIVEVFKTAASIDPAVSIAGQWDEPEVERRLQEDRLLVDAMTGPIGQARLREVLARRPDRAEEYEKAAEEMIRSLRESMRLLQDRLATIRVSLRVGEEHADTFRALAK